MRRARRGARWSFFRAAKGERKPRSSNNTGTALFLLRTSADRFVLSVLTFFRFVLSPTEDRKTFSYQHVRSVFPLVLSVLTFFMQEAESSGGADLNSYPRKSGGGPFAGHLHPPSGARDEPRSSYEVSPKTPAGKPLDSDLCAAGAGAQSPEPATRQQHQPRCREGARLHVVVQQEAALRRARQPGKTPGRGASKV